MPLSDSIYKIFYICVEWCVLHDDNHKDYTYSVMLLLLLVLLPLNWMYIDLFLAFVTIFHSIVVVVVSAVCPLVPQLRARDFLFVCCYFFSFNYSNFAYQVAHIYRCCSGCCYCCYCPLFFLPCWSFVCSSIHCFVYTDGRWIRVCRR